MEKILGIIAIAIIFFLIGIIGGWLAFHSDNKLSKEELHAKKVQLGIADIILYRIEALDKAVGIKSWEGYDENKLFKGRNK